jgi:hypothetical protein
MVPENKLALDTQRTNESIHHTYTMYHNMGLKHTTYTVDSCRITCGKIPTTYKTNHLGTQANTLSHAQSETTTCGRSHRRANGQTTTSIDDIRRLVTLNDLFKDIAKTKMNVTPSYQKARYMYDFQKATTQNNLTRRYNGQTTTSIDDIIRLVKLNDLFEHIEKTKMNVTPSYQKA